MHLLPDRTIDPKWTPLLNAGANAVVSSLALDGDQLYVGGNSTSIGGAARRGLDPGASQLFAVGEFTSIGRVERDAALFDTSAGFLLGRRPDAHVSGYSCTTSLDGSTLYLGGDSVFDVFR